MFLNGIRYDPNNKKQNYEDFVNALENSYDKTVDWEKLYINTNIFTGPLGAFFCLLNIPAFGNGIGEISCDYSIIVAYSGGTDTAFAQIKNGQLTGDVLYLISPQLITQENLQEIRDKGFTKIVVYQGDDVIPHPFNILEGFNIGRFLRITHNLQSEGNIEVINIDSIGHGEWLQVLTNFLKEYGHLPESEDDEENLVKMFKDFENSKAHKKPPEPDNYGYGTQ